MRQPEPPRTNSAGSDPGFPGCGPARLTELKESFSPSCMSSFNIVDIISTKYSNINTISILMSGSCCRSTDPGTHARQEAPRPAARLARRPRRWAAPSPRSLSCLALRLRSAIPCIDSAEEGSCGRLESTNVTLGHIQYMIYKIRCAFTQFSNPCPLSYLRGDTPLESLSPQLLNASARRRWPNGNHAHAVQAQIARRL